MHSSNPAEVPPRCRGLELTQLGPGRHRHGRMPCTRGLLCPGESLLHVELPLPRPLPSTLGAPTQPQPRLTATTSRCWGTLWRVSKLWSPRWRPAAS